MPARGAAVRVRAARLRGPARFGHNDWPRRLPPTPHNWSSHPPRGDVTATEVTEPPAAAPKLGRRTRVRFPSPGSASFWCAMCGPGKRSSGQMRRGKQRWELWASRIPPNTHWQFTSCPCWLKRAALALLYTSRPSPGLGREKTIAAVVCRVRPLLPAGPTAQAIIVWAQMPSVPAVSARCPDPTVL